MGLTDGSPAVLHAIGQHLQRSRHKYSTKSGMANFSVGASTIPQSQIFLAG